MNIRLPLLLVLATSYLPAGSAAPPAKPRVEDLYNIDNVDLPQPDVRIEQYENRMVEEYSVNGNVYMLKITPSSGAPYYLLDPTGTGDLQWRRDDGGMEHRVPQWSLFQW